MGAYTVKNLEDIDAVGTPDGSVQGRMARSALGTTELGVSLFRYAPDTRAPYGHKHATQEEAYVVVSGSGRMRVGDDIVELKQWDAVRVEPTATRGFESGPDGMVLVCVGGKRPPEGDGELVKDFWPSDA